MKKILFLLLLSSTIIPISQSPEENLLTMTLVRVQETLMQAPSLEVFPTKYVNNSQTLDQIDINLRGIAVYAFMLLQLVFKAQAQLENIKVSSSSEASS